MLLELIEGIKNKKVIEEISDMWTNKTGKVYMLRSDYGKELDKIAEINNRVKIGPFGTKALQVFHKVMKQAFDKNKKADLEIHKELVDKYEATTRITRARRKGAWRKPLIDEE